MFWWLDSQHFTSLGHRTTTYPQTYNIRRTLVGNRMVDHTDVVGAWSVGVARTTLSFSTDHLASLDWERTTARRDEKHFKYWDLIRVILGIWRLSLHILSYRRKIWYCEPWQLTAFSISYQTPPSTLSLNSNNIFAHIFSMHFCDFF